MRGARAWRVLFSCVGAAAVVATLGFSVPAALALSALPALSAPSALPAPPVPLALAAPPPLPPGVPVDGARSWEPVPRPPFANGLVLNLPAFSLRLYVGGRLARQYRIAIGRPGLPTPCGDFTIQCRVTTPAWYPPGGGDPVPPGPANPLGNWWLGLSAERYGIHGTNDPASIGHTVSMGCVRLADEEAGDLFGRVAVGWPVTIVYRAIEAWRCLETGERVVALFPDVYWRVDPTSAAAVAELDAALLAAGLDPVVCVARGRLLGDLAARRAGASVPLGVPVRYNGLCVAAGIAAPPDASSPAASLPAAPAPAVLVPLRPLAEAMGETLEWRQATGRAALRGVELGDAVVDGRCYVRPQALARLGLRWAWDAAALTLDISAVTVVASAGGDGVACPALVVGGRVMAELFPLAAALGLDVAWRDAATVNLFAPLSPGTGPGGEPGAGPSAEPAAVPITAFYDVPCVALDDLAAAVGGAYWSWQPGSNVARVVRRSS